MNVTQQKNYEIRFPSFTLNFKDVIKRRLMSFGKSAGILKPVLGLSLVIFMLSIPRVAHARSGKIVLETIGTGVAVGSVLGASTLPFYDQPGLHLNNLAYGAAAGAVVGLGVSLYRLLLRSPVDNESAHSISNSPIQTSEPVRDGFSASASAMTGAGPKSAPNRPTPAVWTPLVSLTW